MNLINLFYKNEYFIRIVPYYFTGYDEKGGIMNQYKDASEDAKKLCQRLIAIEEELRKCLHAYL